MNYTNYETWQENKLIPSLPPNSVVVVDSASYRSVQVDPAPTSASTKAEMQMWLSSRNIPFTRKPLKPELYEMIRKYKPQYKT
jgi:hypothetical protein